MRFARLRLAGFKSFVEPAELVIRDGLTGIVGPNGCGKSNLLEAIRWVMGESSAKSLRVEAGGDGMDAVIFAGTARRPSRDVAEVALTLDNSLRQAPPQFNDMETIEVSRKIWRGEGSSYAINGREVRQKDVRLLFADAATGAHSPALVSQGRVAAIIAARPSERRLLLEEAAGISGLAVRRKEAETRLRAADANLLRLDDIMQAAETQAAALKRQARQAERYRELSTRIRATEAAILRLSWDAARHDLARAEADLATAEAGLAEAVREAEASAAAQATEAATLPAKRQAETEAQMRVRDLSTRRATLIAERDGLKQRIADLAANLQAAQADAEREAARARDSVATRARLATEREQVQKELAAAAAEAAPQAEAVTAAEEEVTQAERALAVAMEAHATLVADARGVRAQMDAAQQRWQRLKDERGRLVVERARLDDASTARLMQDMADVEAELAARAADAAAAGEKIAVAEREFQAAAQAREAVESALAAARSELQSLEAEAKALERLASGNAQVRRRIPLEVADGYEAAVAAALGDDMYAGIGESSAGGKGGDSARIWRGVMSHAEDPPLPSFADSLAGHIRAPDELARRMAQIGLVDATPTAAMIAGLAPGQRLVSREGRLWRWDGFEAGPGAKAAAVAAALAQDNRRKEIARAIGGPRERAAEAETELERLRAAIRAAQEAERHARGLRTTAERAREQLSARLQGLAKAAAQQEARASAMDASIERLSAEEATVRKEAERTSVAVASLPDTNAAAEDVRIARGRAEHSRATLVTARAAAAATERICAESTARIAALAREIDAWVRRDAEAAATAQVLAERIGKMQRDHAELVGEPDARDALLTLLEKEVAGAEAAADLAAQAVAAAELTLSGLEERARAAQNRVADGREGRATLFAAVEQARKRIADLRQNAIEHFGCQPQQLECPEDGESEALEQLLGRLKAERERLGIVNLRAAIELEELQGELTMRATEREELMLAISRLRGSIASLDREGRARTLQAFTEIDGHFRSLFTTLFGGGAAELQLTESDDPLAAGLEIRAQPPGKKLQSLSLLSGGEQALTACALIFALFLTNPAPICVLDEVDAPLDDANVERFIRLLEHMFTSTATRFLIVTHNPLTMSRMHRLYGVTMGEPGVSQLVSVELHDAEALLAA